MSRHLRFPSYPNKPHSSGQARIKFRGKVYYLGPFGSPSSWKEYRRLLTEWEQGLTPKPRTTSTAHTVSEVIAAYSEFAARYYCTPDGKPTKQIDRVNAALAFARDLYGPRPVSEFDQDALEEVQEEMVRAGYYRKTVNGMVGCIRRCWKWAARKKLVPVESYAVLRLVEDLAIQRTTAPESVPVKPVPIEHVLRTIPFLWPPVAAMVRLQMLTGMRPGEVLIMRAMDLDQNDPSCWLYRPGSELPYGRHKNSWRGQHRVVLLGPQAQEILKPFLERDPSAWLFSPREALAALAAAKRAKRKTKVQPSQIRRNAQRAKRRAKGPVVRDHYTNETYPRAVSRACKAAKVPHWHPNQLRHLVATRTRQEHGPDAARALLGQKSLKAAEIYAELDLHKVAEIMRQSG